MIVSSFMGRNIIIAGLLTLILVVVGLTSLFTEAFSGLRLWGDQESGIGKLYAGDWVDAENGQYVHENATLLSLVRNQEVDDMVSSMISLEKAFNHHYNYTWTFINDVPFTKSFKARTSAVTKAKTQYFIIPKEHWTTPSFIDKNLMSAAADMLKDKRVQYSDKESYHKMCRWNSGLFYKHPDLQQYKYYWRVEPHVQFFCDVNYDVFKFMARNEKTYGFVINVYDDPNSIPSLWPRTLEFIKQNPTYVHPENAQKWLTDSKRRPQHTTLANGYSTCHFWSNFEIGDMDFFRGEAYDSYFQYLDRAGGFFYERWGDAPVHSIGLGLFLPRSQIHWFEDIGYNHIPYWNCPRSKKCAGCKGGKFFEGVGLEQENCMPVWHQLDGK